MDETQMKVLAKKYGFTLKLTTNPKEKLTEE